MKSVGLVTLFERNYGSALQCYATKKTVEELGYHCDVLGFGNQGFDRYKHYAKELIKLAWNSVRYKGYYTDYRSIRSARIHYSRSLSEQSAKKLWLFKETVLQAGAYSEGTLRMMGSEEKYAFFITGSDQVWNGHKSVIPEYFLRFAPERKRIALAASFGTDSIPKYNRRLFSKFISEIPAVSVREEDGVKIVKELTGRDVERLSDPTVLLEKERWRQFARDGQKHGKPYIFAHFLDTPSPQTVAEIAAFAKERDLDILLFAYPHATMKAEDGFCFVDGGPQDYLSLIDGAEIVCTDSFHTSLFCVRFGTRLAVYHRQYRHNHPQTSRIETLLRQYDYRDRIRDEHTCLKRIADLPMHDCDEKVKTERERMLAYLCRHIGSAESERTDVPRLKDRYDCTGCGVCSIVCPHGAIAMQADETGSHRPVVDRNACVRCGVCERACYREVPVSQEYPDAYIAYNTDEDLALRSASGGIFSALGAEVIRQGGVVYGAAMEFDENGVRVLHKEATTPEELEPLLGSKYVQSDCAEAYKSIYKRLSEGKTVLFGGTSCQVNGLYRYLGDKPYEHLYTLDLICHGVPGQKLLSDYIAYLERRRKDRVNSFSFRTKRDGEIRYELNIGYEKSGTEVIPKLKSSYYRLFMSMNSYRENCYNCAYASIYKPADVTAGDYFEVREDYPDIYERELRGRPSVSSLLVHTPRGRELMSRFGKSIRTIQADAAVIQASHGNLRKPSRYSDLRKTFHDKLRTSGYEGVERYFKIRDASMYLPKKLLRKGMK